MCIINNRLLNWQSQDQSSFSRANVHWIKILTFFSISWNGNNWCRATKFACLTKNAIGKLTISNISKKSNLDPYRRNQNMEGRPIICIQVQPENPIHSTLQKLQGLAPRSHLAPENGMNKYRRRIFRGDFYPRFGHETPLPWFLSRVRTASIWLLAPTLCISSTKQHQGECNHLPSLKQT